MYFCPFFIFVYFVLRQCEASTCKVSWNLTLCSKMTGPISEMRSSFLFVACGNYAKANDRTAQCHVNINIAPTGYVCIFANGTGFCNLIGKLAELRIEQKLFFSKKKNKTILFYFNWYTIFGCLSWGSGLLQDDCTVQIMNIDHTLPPVT